MDKKIKNIPHEEIVTLRGLVPCQDGEVVSRTLAENDALSVTAVACSEG